MSEFCLVPRSALEKAIELLECLDSPSPTDFFVYLDTLYKLTHILHEIDIDIHVNETIYIDGKFRCCGSSASPAGFSQAGISPMLTYLNRLH